jgi:GDPmannose 4,6-dehydratase
LSPVALITGINGQDGSYLAELLLRQGYRVHGTIRRSSTWALERIDHLKGKVELHFADLSDTAGLTHLVRKIRPDEVYNLAAMSDVRVSFDTPQYAGLVTGLGALAVLEAVRVAAPGARVYQAGSSEMFGGSDPEGSNEATPFDPQSPYAAAKVYGYHVARNYRDAYGMFVANGILFNHESPRRGVEFVTRKITRGAAAIVKGEADSLTLGNLNAFRDWGYAPEYMRAAWLMLQQNEPDDYVIATGETHSVQEFAEETFAWLGLDFLRYVKFDSALLRPTEVHVLLGDASKAKRVLGWEPETKFKDLARIMIQADVEARWPVR